MSKVVASEVLGDVARMDYDAESQASREALAISFEIAMHFAGFKREETDPHTRERVFSREVPGTGIRVKIFSSVIEGGLSGQTVREAGKDAIRVVALYKGRDGRDRGVAKTTRVHRVGQVGAIMDRTLERAREAWSKAKTGQRCPSCGAPKFTAKSGNLVCAEICWTRVP